MDGSGIGSLAAVAARTAIVLTATTIALRLFGKRRIGEMNVYDLLLVLIMANAVQNAMTQGNGHLAAALAAAGTLILLGWLAATAMAERPLLERRLMGTPTVLALDGRIIRPNLRRESVSESDVMRAVRQQGLADLADVKLAVLEVDGTISVCPRSLDEKDRTA